MEEQSQYCWVMNRETVGTNAHTSEAGDQGKALRMVHNRVFLCFGSALASLVSEECPIHCLYSHKGKGVAT